ncbi:hypothetical protein [Undibacterium aquatile]|uniref:Uncharacterized protein n=1 Tax=Undibacterium aquatile TaxID=1537398 RepID=A0ABR6XAX1_9BURK|nr:hypothetical protein [Undibacterium aquatile]MBC3810080.1 hypothetical protein [Undibacterium aquatile]
MDWNWFFSSLSQSSAAIVGIFGAFIITKILSNQAQFGERSARFKSLRAAASKLENSASNLAFAWYVRLTAENQLEKAEDLLEKDDNLTSDDLYAKLRFPPYLARENAIRTLQSVKDRRSAAAEAERQRIQKMAQLQAERRSKFGAAGALMSAGMSGDGFTIPMQPHLPRGLASINNFHAELQKEREAIDALEVEIRHHMRTISDFLEATSSNPESSAAIMWALTMVAALFLVGVIYPLSFMPSPVPWTPALEIHGFWDRAFSLRGMLLIFISLIFLSALTMFALMNRRMRYSPDEIQALGNFTHIGTYSRYYAIAEENESIAREIAKSS